MLAENEFLDAPIAKPTPEHRTVGKKIPLACHLDLIESLALHVDSESGNDQVSGLPALAYMLGRESSADKSAHVVHTLYIPKQKVVCGMACDAGDKTILRQVIQKGDLTLVGLLVRTATDPLRGFTALHAHAMGQLQKAWPHAICWMYRDSAMQADASVHTQHAVLQLSEKGIKIVNNCTFGSPHAECATTKDCMLGPDIIDHVLPTWVTRRTRKFPTTFRLYVEVVHLHMYTGPKACHRNDC